MKKGVLFLIGIMIISLLCGVTLSGCGEAGDSTSPDNTPNIPSDSQGTEGIYVGIIKFAGDATDLTGGAPILLDSAGKDTLINTLNNNYNMATQAGTALAYSVHKALANLKSNDAKYPANLDSVNIVTFTDGYDISSVTWSSRTGNSIEGKTFSANAEYADYVKAEIANRKIAEKTITAYSVGVRGDDVPPEYYTVFQDSLNNIASAGKSKELTNFDEVQSAFNDIADGLNIVHTNTAFVLVTAGLDNGTKVRMTFDVTSTNPTSAEAAASTKYIEGVYNFDPVTQIDAFTNITYAGGIASGAGAGPITGTIDGTEVNFTFNGITGYDLDQDGPNIKQWLMDPGMTTWRENSEYSSDGSSTSTVEKRSSIIYLVLDCSTSLKINETSQIPQIRTAAIEFINSLYNRNYTPGVPSGVTATAESANSIKVSWNAVSGAAGYKVYYTLNGGSSIEYLTETSQTSYTHSGLQAGNYIYYVTAVNSVGESQQSKSTDAISITLPGVPTGVTTVQESVNSIKISWNAVSEAANYKVYYTFNGSPVEYLEGTSFVEYLTETSLTSYTHSELDAGEYVYYVSAVNSVGESNRSNFISFNTISINPELTYDVWNHGDIVSADDEHTFSIYVTSGTTYYIWLDDDDSQQQGRVNAVVNIYSRTNGGYLRTITSAYSTPNKFTPAFSGVVRITVAGYGNSTGAYSIAYNTTGNRP